MGYAHAVLLVLFVTGFALFSYGVTYKDNTAGPRLNVESVDAVPDGSNVVHYRDLPDPLRAAFDRALESESMAVVAAASTGFDTRYVEYDGGFYRVTVVAPGEGGAAVELPLGLVGLVLSVLSTVVYLLLRRETHGRGPPA